MKQFFCSLVIAFGAFLVSSFSQGAPSLDAGLANASTLVSGNSLAEKQIRWVWSHRNDFIKACAMTDCIQQEPLKTLLPKLQAITQNSSLDQVKFISEKSNPGFFSSNLGESHRIAITGRTVGDPIYFNSDLINQLSLENMVALLFHEWTHHLGVNDDAQRLPDQVGALIAKIFTQNLLYSPYSGPDNLRMVSAVFQFPPPKGNLLEERFFYTDFAFLTDGNSLFDTDLSKFTVFAACDKEDHRVGAQNVQTPHWRDLGNVSGKRKLRLTMIMVNVCLKNDARGTRAENHQARRGYTFDLDLDENGQMLPSSSEYLGSPLNADIDMISTIDLVSMKLSKKQVKVGDTLEITAQVNSFTNLNPKTCYFGISSEGAPVQAGGYPVVAETPNCQVKVIGDHVWEISTSFKISSGMVRGNYYPRSIQVVGEGMPNMALLILPEENGFAVDNAQVTAAASIMSIEVAKNLTSVSKFGDQAVTNSYVYSQGQEIELRINVKAGSAVQIKGLLTYTMAAINGGLQAIQNSGSLADFTGFNMKQKTVVAGPDQQTIILTFTVPQSWQNSPLFGISIQRIYVEDEAFQQVVWQASGNWDYLFIDKQLFNANR